MPYVRRLMRSPKDCFWSLGFEVLEEVRGLGNERWRDVINELSGSSLGVGRCRN